MEPSIIETGQRPTINDDQLQLELILAPYLVYWRSCPYLRLRKSVKLTPDKDGQLLELTDLIDALWDAKSASSLKQ